MDPIATFFIDNIAVVYFLYGLAFFTMGLVVWLESNRTSEFRITRAFGLLAGFGIVHGLHEWFEMFQVLSRSEAANIPGWLLLNEIRIPHLVISFILLLTFGVRLLLSGYQREGREQRLVFITVGGLVALWFVSTIVTQLVYNPTHDEFVKAVDVLARYILGIPGALLAAWAIVLEQRSVRARGAQRFGRDLQWAAWALILYGFVGQMFPAKSFLFPSTVINSELFLKTFGIPIQFFRATEAGLMAVFFIRALRAFELERQQRLAAAQAERLTAQQEAIETQKQAQQQTVLLNKELQEREKLLANLLHQVVSAQEGERQRIARELHDGAGQILTGLGLGLAAAEESVFVSRKLAAKQLNEMKRLSTQALEELHNVIRDLRPSVLDDLGLVPALKAQVRALESRTDVKADFSVEGKSRRMPAELETIVFRIGQEALTNVTKHANAKSVSMRLLFSKNCLKLLVKDDGQGFDPERVLRPGENRRMAWGLLGMQERVGLVGGVCFILSKPGEGTLIHATIPLNLESIQNVKEN